MKSCGLEAASNATSSVMLPAIDVLEQRLVEGLHPVVLALGDHLGDLAGLLRVEDQVLDPAGDDHDLADRDAAVAVDARHEPLRDRAAQRRGEHHPRLLLEVRGKKSMIRLIVSVASRVCSVESTRCPVSAAAERRAHGLLVAHLADQDHVGVLAQHPAHRAREALRVLTDLALVDDRALVAVQVLDRVLERDDVARRGSS